MTRVRVIPVLLMKDNGLVKTRKFKDPVYVGDPINAVRIFNEKQTDEICILDISATQNKRKPNFKKIEEIASECFMPLSYGGGISNLNDAIQLFSLGVEKIILNSVLKSDPSLITKIAERFGSQSVVVSVDCKKLFLGGYDVVSNSAKSKLSSDPIAFAKSMVDLGAGELIVHAVDRDGMQNGYDLELINKISKSVSIPTVACGGASSIKDFELAVSHGASAVAAGSFFVFHGKHRAVLISYPSSKEIDLIGNVKN